MYRRNSIYYIDKRLPGFGRFGPISTRTKRQQTADGIESMVTRLADKGRLDVLKLFSNGALPLADAYVAYSEGHFDALVKERDTSNNPPLRDAIESFMLVSKDPRYQSTFNWILRKAPKGARLSWLADSEDVQILLNGRLDDGCKPATVARDKAAISALLGHHLGEAQRREILHRVGVKQPNNGRLRWLSKEEIDRLRERSGDWWVVWCVLLSFGIRRREMIQLRVEDIDFDAGQVRIWGTKSESAKRVLPLGGEVVALLRGWIAANGLERSDLLFPTLGRSRGWYVWRAWRDCCEKAGIEGATVHDLRHTFAVHAVKTGTPLPELQRRLGHSRMKETWRYASYVPPARSEHATQALERMGLSGPVPTDIPTLGRKTVLAL